MTSAAECTDLPSEPGTYALAFEVTIPATLCAGALGVVLLEPGRYIYVGSACGPGGLKARVSRHLRTKKRMRWHVDYLSAAFPVAHVVAVRSTDPLECAWVQRLLELPGVAVACRHFGSGDCRKGCPAHLLRLPDSFDISRLEPLLSQRSQIKAMNTATFDQVQALLDAIAAGNDDAAERAAQTYAGRSWLLPALRPLLADADADRRWWAVRTLALIGGEEAQTLLIHELADPDEPTRCAAALALGNLRAANAIPMLIDRLADASGWVRDSAADALAMIGEGALPALVQALADKRESVRVRAAGALRKVLVPALSGRKATDFGAQYWPAIGALFEALNDPNRLVRHNAYEALDRLGLLETVIVPG